MKTFINLPIIVLLVVVTITLRAENEIPPYFKIGNFSKDINGVAEDVKSALLTHNFEIIGEYSPEGKDKFRVVAYSRKDLQAITLKVKDRGAQASILKIGLQEKEGTVEVSMLNPMYLFYAYLRDDTDNYIKELNTISNDVKNAMKELGTEFSGFGGGEEPDDLKDYHYMAFMPYFDDPVELNKFSSFEEGLDVIRKNLEAKKGNTLKVFELVFENEKTAIFGIGLLDKEEGESHFLPIIGEDHIAAMPYEIILQDKEATMLHGKYRFALHWPELSMSQFMKIMSTPGDVEEVLKGITE